MYVNFEDLKYLEKTREQKVMLMAGKIVNYLDKSFQVILSEETVATLDALDFAIVLNSVVDHYRTKKIYRAVIDSKNGDYYINLEVIYVPATNYGVI